MMVSLTAVTASHFPASVHGFEGSKQTKREIQIYIYFHYPLDKLVNCLVYKMSENTEKYPSPFARTQKSMSINNQSTVQKPPKVHHKN